VERARSRLLVARATVIAPAGERVVRLHRELVRAASHRAQRARVALDGLDRQLRSLGPQAVLERGYSLTRTGDGTLVRHAAQVAPGTVVRTQVASGEFESIVR
jgi:exodeoxyribonuclease VII large subunit